MMIALTDEEKLQTLKSLWDQLDDDTQFIWKHWFASGHSKAFPLPTDSNEKSEVPLAPTRERLNKLISMGALVGQFMTREGGRLYVPTDPFIKAWADVTLREPTVAPILTWSMKVYTIPSFPPKMLLSPYGQGKYGHQGKRRLKDCPYSPGSYEATDWQAGWKDASAAQRKTRKS